MLDTMAQTITGPATTNILEHIPSIMPSRLNSMALEQMLFAKPVIGIIVPAPANFAKSSKIPSPVKRHVKNIITISVHVPSSDSVMLGNQFCRQSVTACPKQQIKPPTTNAKKSDGQSSVLGDFAETYAKYLLLRSSLSIYSPTKLLPNIAN